MNAQVFFLEVQPERLAPEDADLVDLALYAHVRSARGRPGPPLRDHGDFPGAVVYFVETERDERNARRRKQCGSDTAQGYFAGRRCAGCAAPARMPRW